MSEDKKETFTHALAKALFGQLPVDLPLQVPPPVTERGIIRPVPEAPGVHQGEKTNGA